MLKAVLPIPLAALALVAPAAAVPASREKPVECRLTTADKLANAQLSFDEFDQKGVSPATARQLAKRGCYAEAAEATEDYLARAPTASELRHTSLVFHSAQYLAMSGDDRGAARVILAAKRSSQTADAPFDWNSYVTGTWAFLVKDRPLFDAAHKTLQAKPGKNNQINANALAGLARCFEKTYQQAYTPCRPPLTDAD